MINIKKQFNTKFQVLYHVKNLQMLKTTRTNLRQAVDKNNVMYPMRHTKLHKYADYCEMWKMIFIMISDITSCLPKRFDDHSLSYQTHK